MSSRRFSRDVQQWLAKVERRRRDLFINVASATLRSIQFGSPVTGAPGQPVQSGALLNSWQLTFESQVLALIATRLVYAPLIEDGEGPYGPLRLRSAVGGFHSVKLTRAGFRRIVESEARALGAPG